MKTEANATAKHTAEPKAILRCADCHEPIKGGAETCDECGSSLMEWRPVSCVETVKHTATPWHTNGLGDIIDQNDRGFAEVHQTLSHPSADERAANAARIVACVNACAGMEDPAKAIEGARKALHAAGMSLRRSWGDGIESYPESIRESLRALGG